MFPLYIGTVILFFSHFSWILSQVLQTPMNFEVSSLVAFTSPEYYVNQPNTTLLAVAYKNRRGYIQILEPTTAIGKNGELHVRLHTI